MATSIVVNATASVQAGIRQIQDSRTAGFESGIGVSQSPGRIQAVGKEVTAARSDHAPSVHDVSKISKESVEAAAEKIQSFISSMKRDLNIYVDNSTGRSVIRVVDSESSQLIRQIPPEESIRLAQTVDFLSSLLVHQRA